MIFSLLPLQKPFRGFPPMVRLSFMQYPFNRTMKKFVIFAKTEGTSLSTLPGKGATASNKITLKHPEVFFRLLKSQYISGKKPLLSSCGCIGAFENCLFSIQALSSDQVPFFLRQTSFTFFNFFFPMPSKLQSFSRTCRNKSH